MRSQRRGLRLGGLAVDLVSAGCRAGDDGEEMALVEVSGLVHAVAPVRRHDAGPPQARRGPGRERAEDESLADLPREARAVVAERAAEALARQAERADAVVRGELEEQGKDRRVEGNVHVPVDVRQAEPGCLERPELRLDLMPQLRAAPRARDGEPRVAQPCQD